MGNKNSKGFTLIEMLIVLMIIGWSAGMVAIRYYDAADKQRPIITLANMQNISTALDILRRDCHTYPTTDQGLGLLLEDDVISPVKHWDGPYIHGSRLPADPWGNAFIYLTAIPKESFELWSIGPNEKDDNKLDDDIVF